ncbi:MAG: hypothetical protein C0623_09100 [Desulfuromonas sp.]|nr:MAG: hypothetical protein C0623_09100 [Desulfuromonas sp.]
MICPDPERVNSDRPIFPVELYQPCFRPLVTEVDHLPGPVKFKDSAGITLNFNDAIGWMCGQLLAGDDALNRKTDPFSLC